LKDVPNGARVAATSTSLGDDVAAGAHDLANRASALLGMVVHETYPERHGKYVTVNDATRRGAMAAADWVRLSTKLVFGRTRAFCPRKPTDRGRRYRSPVSSRMRETVIR